jgi:hypothetical protein
MISILIKKSGESVFTDRTEDIADVNIVQGTTKEATTGRLVVNQFGSKYIPEGEDEIEIYDGDDKVFGGFIVRVNQKIKQGPVVVFECDLKNYSYLLDRKLVNKTYQSELVSDIIDDIVANFSGPGITTTNVEIDASLSVSYISFNNVQPSQAIQELADIFNKEWYVDNDADIHFFSKFAEVAPFSLSDDGGNHVFDSLVFKKDFSQIRNSILVQGGDEKSTATETDNFVGDGSQHTFSLSRKYTDITVTVGGASKTVGIANIDSFTSYDCLYDFNLHTLYFNPSSPPAASAAIVVSGKYYFPIAVRFREATSISLFGEREFLIQSDTIKSRTDAVARAAAEISAFSQNVSEGSFETYRSGLRAGQKINISSVLFGVSGQYIIQRISGRMNTPMSMIWRAEIVSVKTYELIDLLAQIIKGRKIQVSQDAVIQTAERVNRSILVGRTITIMTPASVSKDLLLHREMRDYLNDPPIWVAAPYIPASIDDRKRKAYVDRGCEAS